MPESADRNNSEYEHFSRRVVGSFWDAYCHPYQFSLITKQFCKKFIEEEWIEEWMNEDPWIYNNALKLGLL